MDKEERLNFFIKQFKCFQEAIEKCDNLHIYESVIVTKTKLERYETIVVSISGGSDSDIMLDLIVRIAYACNIPLSKFRFVFFDTGIEYQATKKHLDCLERKYGITIERMRAKMPVPLGCRKYGLPFWSKYVSEMIERLQRYDFKWEDRPFNELIKEYPKCKGALKWWCNEFGENSRFNIEHTRRLKEFMIENPPMFKISPKCCNGAKKDTAKAFMKKHRADLNMTGIRKAEGGIRSTAYKTCFNNGKAGQAWDNYRPIFWYEGKDKEYYEQFFGVEHSACYCKYGLDRTGCAGCPFGKNFEVELKIIEGHEPKLYKAVNNIFGESYEYTRRFIEFRENLYEVDGIKYIQTTIFDEVRNG